MVLIIASNCNDLFDKQMTCVLALLDYNKCLLSQDTHFSVSEI
jgi:hypothetical protein